MASSDNLLTMIEQPWSFRTPTTLVDNYSWSNNSLSDMFFPKELESYALTRALHETISSSASPPSQNDSVLLPSPDECGGGVLFPKPMGSESDGHVSKQQAPRRKAAVGPGGRVARRKLRTSKRQTTTFITADPSNFRQMVQQITGVRLGAGGGLASADDVAHVVMKPEPQRLLNGGFSSSSPAFDGSGFLLGRSVSASVGQARSGTVDFDSFCSFPTLESSKF